MRKKLLSSILTVCMILTMLPVTALAAAQSTAPTSAALSGGNETLTVTLAATPTADDVIKVYDAATDGNLLKTHTIADTETEQTITLDAAATGNVYVTFTDNANGNTESDRVESTGYVVPASAAPEFAQDGNIYTMTSVNATTAEFTLKSAGDGITFKAYDAATGGNVSSAVSNVAVNGTTLTLTLAAAPTQNATYYISATEQGKTESATRTAVTVKPYVLKTFTIAFAAGAGASGTMAQVEVTEGTEYTLPSCNFTAPANQGFTGWSVVIGTAGAEDKNPGDKITVTANVTVTAKWASSDASLTSVLGQSITATGVGTKANPKTASITVASDGAAQVTSADIVATGSTVKLYSDAFTTEGNVTLTAGEKAYANILVTAADGSVCYYRITITKEAAKKEVDAGASATGTTASATVDNSKVNSLTVTETDTVVIGAVANDSNVTKSEITLTTDAVDKLKGAGNTEIATDVATVTLPKAAMDTIDAAGSEVKLVVESKGTTTSATDGNENNVKAAFEVKVEKTGGGGEVALSGLSSTIVLKFDISGMNLTNPFMAYVDDTGAVKRIRGSRVEGNYLVAETDHLTELVILDGVEESTITAPITLDSVAKQADGTIKASVTGADANTKAYIQAQKGNGADANYVIVSAGISGNEVNARASGDTVIVWLVSGADVPDMSGTGDLDITLWAVEEVN